MRVRKSRVLAAVVLVVGAGLGLYVRWLNVPPALGIVNPRSLSPNSFDALCAAARLQRDGTTTADTLNLYFEGNVELTLTEKDAILLRNDPAIRAAKAALQLPDGHPQDLNETRLDVALKNLHDLCQLIAFEGEVKAAHHDHFGAAQSDMDAIEVAIATPRGGGLAAQQVGTGSEAIGEEQLWDEVEQLDFAEASSAVQRLESIFGHRVALAETIRREKARGQSDYVALLNSGSTLALFESRDKMKHPVVYYDGLILGMGNPGLDGKRKTLTAAKTVEAYKYLLIRSKSQVLADYGAMMDGYAAATETSFGTRHAVAASTFPIDEPIDMLFQGVYLADARRRMDTGLLTTALSLRAYRVKHACYPEMLDNLVVDGLLRQVPEDPYAKASHSHFIYKRLNSTRFILYSVGVDGIDNGGTPVKPSIDVDSRAPFDFGEVGDWVVGVNAGKVSPRLANNR